MKHSILYSGLTFMVFALVALVSWTFRPVEEVVCKKERAIHCGMADPLQLDIFTLGETPMWTGEDGGRVADYVRKIYQDSHGFLWFGTNGYGICKFNGKSLEYFGRNAGLPSTQVTAILERKNGELWIGTGGGIAIFNGNSFTSYTKDQGLSDPYIRSIFEDSRGSMWVGTLKGVSLYNGEAFEPFPLADLKEVMVYHISEDREGNIWFGTDGAGAIKYNGESLESYGLVEGLCSNEISSIIQDSSGDFWFGSLNCGISRFDGKKFVNYSEEVEGTEVWTVFEDKNKHIWFGSEGYGLYRFDGEHFRNFSLKEGLGITAVQAIFQDDKGMLWVGGGGGLYCYDGRNGFMHVGKEGPWDNC